jgi:uncharacterized protein
MDAVAGLTAATVIVGGSDGLGLAMARLLTAKGRPVMLVARDASRLTKAAAELGASYGGGARIMTLAADATDPATPPMIDRMLRDGGLFSDDVILAAGVGLAGAFDSHTPTDIDALVALNVAAMTRCVRHWLPGQLGRARGGILVVSSLAAFTPGPFQAAYYASKAYALSLVEALAAENRGRGVRLCVVAPGPLDTSFHDRMHATGSRYRWAILQGSTEMTAAAALRGYDLGSTVVPIVALPAALGWAHTPLSWLVTVAMRVLPHTLLVPLMSWLLRPTKARRVHDDHPP